MPNKKYNNLNGIVHTYFPTREESKRKVDSYPHRNVDDFNFDVYRFMRRHKQPLSWPFRWEFEDDLREQSKQELNNQIYTRETTTPSYEPVIVKQSEVYKSKPNLLLSFDKIYNDFLGGKYSKNNGDIDWETLRNDPGYQETFNQYMNYYHDRGFGYRPRYIEKDLELEQNPQLWLQNNPAPKQFNDKGHLTDEYKNWINYHMYAKQLISKNKQGGKMNKINYFQKGGKNLPTAPNAKEAYQGGTYISGKNSDKIIGPAEKYYVPRQITRTIGPNSDTTYVEKPKYFVPEGEFIHVKPRKANSLDKDRTEYEILNRRFNEAASVSKKQQGGQMQQNIQQQIIQLVQAAMQGDQKATQTIQQVMQAAEQGDQQAIQLAQMIQQVMEQMKGQATMAKWGSKLEYIKNLKYAKGGKTCPSCQKNISTNPLKKSTTKVEEKACGGKTKKR